MTTPDVPRPAPGDTDWIDWADEQETASDVVERGRLTDATLKQTFAAASHSHAAATTTAAGFVRLATTTEHGAGTDDTLAATPAGIFSSRVISRLRQNAQTNLAANVWDLIPLQVADIDTHSGWVSTAATRWTCPTGQGGTYAVDGVCAFNSIPGAQVGGSRLDKNGAVLSGSSCLIYNGATGSLVIPTGHTLVSLVPGDYIEMRAYAQSATTTRVTADGISSSLSIERIR